MQCNKIQLMLKLKPLTVIIGSVIILGLISQEMTHAIGLSNKDSNSKNHRATKNSKKNSMKEYIRTSLIFANGLEGRKEVRRSSPKSIINFCKNYDLNNDSVATAIIYQIDECRKTMPCAKKNRFALITTIYGDRTAKARDISVACVK
jgi:hypothetical protein